MTGDDGSQALVPATTGDLIAAFVSTPLAGPGDPMAQVMARHPSVRREQANAAGVRAAAERERGRGSGQSSAILTATAPAA